MEVLLLHGVRDLQTLRRTTLNQSFCLLKHAPEHNYTVHCFGHAVTRDLREREFDAIIIDTTFLCYRWARPRSIFSQLMEDYHFIGASRAVKIALPQDDYDHAAILDEWMAAWGVDAVFTPLAVHAELLNPLTARRARILPCFTGHLDPVDRAVAARFARRFESREIDVGYRTRELPAQFGRLGRMKSEIGRRFAEALGPNHGLRLEISTRPRDVLSGDRWLLFLCNSRFTLGSASGSSLVDPRGEIMDAIRDYLRERPAALFDEIEAACFPGLDGQFELAGIGPRMIETALAESCQILVPSPHLAPFEPDEHYIPLAADCSNISDVRLQMCDTPRVKRRIAAALELVCETPSFRIENFASRILAEIERIREDRRLEAAQKPTTPNTQDAVESLLAEQRIIVRLATAELVQTAIDAPGQKLSLRTGRYGAIRELLGVNNAMLPDGSIDLRRPRTLGLRTYYLLLRFHELNRGIRALLERGRSQLHALRHRLRNRGIWDVLRTSLSRRLAVRQDARRIIGPLRRLLRIVRGALPPSLPAQLRRVAGLGATSPGTITMLVADDSIDRRVLLSARSLHQAGWRVRVIALPYPRLTDDDQRMFPEIDIVRIKPRRYPTMVKSGTPLAARAWDWYAAYPYYFHFLELAVRYPASLYVAHDLPVLASAVVAARLFGSHVVYDAHELYPEQHHFKPEYAELLNRVEAELIRSCDLVTTVNESIAQEIATRYRISSPAVILNTPAAAEGTLPLAHSPVLRERLGLAGDRKILLFQGSLSLNRNLEALAHAMAFVQRPEIVLVFLGPDGGKLEKLKQIARDLGLLGNRIFFLDPVPQEILLSWTAGADVGIVPYPPIDLNSQLCTPNKLFEFIVAGVPILANDLPELRRFVVGNGFGIVRPMHGPEAIAAAIDQMMSKDPSVWRTSLDRRRAEFVWDRQGQKLVELYRNLPRRTGVSQESSRSVTERVPAEDR